VASRAASKSKKRAAKKRVRVPAPARPQAPPARPVARAGRAGRIYAYALGTAVLLGALLIGLSQLSVHGGKASAGTPSGGVTAIASTAALLDGIPQHGNTLGSPTAPVQLVEYADLQCPYCAVYSRDLLPTLIRDYVRTGKVQLVYRGLAFIGPDSVSALRTATAAAAQNRMWNVVELLFANQGAENAWVNDGLLRSIVTAAGASPTRVFATRDGSAVTRSLASWANSASAGNVTGTPTFFFGRRGARLDRLALSTLDVSQFRAALDGALQG
jgi:protein-disulfide isomerase